MSKPMQPGRWWRVVYQQGRVWCETSDEDEARAALLTCPETGTLQRIYERTERRWCAEGETACVHNYVPYMLARADDSFAWERRMLTRPTYPFSCTECFDVVWYNSTEAVNWGLVHQWFAGKKSPFDEDDE